MRQSRACLKYQEVKPSSTQLMVLAFGSGAWLENLDLVCTVAHQWLNRLCFGDILQGLGLICRRVVRKHVG